MNKKGFTLVELLGVIVVLGVLTLVMFPLLLGQINKTKKGISDATKTIIIEAAKDYYDNNKDEYKKINGISYCLDLETLARENYLDTNIKDENLNDIDTSEQVEMTYINNNFAYEVVDSCTYSLKKSGVKEPILSEEDIENNISGIYAEELGNDRFIYRGANPNNYIWLDENKDTIKQGSETYRIISYESDGTIKVIRDTSIGNYAWDTATSGPRHNTNNTYCNYTGTYYGCNVWGTQENTYYNDTTLTNLNQDFLYKYYPNNTTQSLQNYTNNGTVTQNASLNVYLNNEWTTKQNLDNYISNHPFNVGGIYYPSTYPASEAKTLSQEKEEQNIYTWNGKIGLMNITDYVDASLNPTCTNVYSNFYYNSNYYYDTNGDGTKEQTISGYDNWPCSNRSYNWMAKAINEWSLSPNSYSRYIVLSVNSSGGFYNSFAYNAYGVRPAFYLKSSVVLTGTGTITDPYKIKN